jgi:hypothetical protein
VIVFRSVYDPAPPLLLYANSAFADLLSYSCVRVNGPSAGCSVLEL